MLRLAVLAAFALVAVPAAAQVGGVPSAQAPSIRAATVEVDAQATVGATDRPTIGYASLSDAVAAQPAEDDDAAVTCLAGAVYFEAKGEPIDGQLAVAEVIMNRVASGRFRGDVCSVVKQPGQFGFVRAGVIPTVDPGRSQYRQARAVAHVALARAWASTAPRALYFHGRREPGSARWTRVASIGNHVFYR